jgi:tetratricopeptide (TPR) repeat protein
VNNRLPPAWSKHVKPGPTPKPNLPTANSLSRGQAHEALLKQAYALLQAKRLNEAQDLCLRVLSRTPNHPLALYILGTICLGYEDEAALRYFARAVGEDQESLLSPRRSFEFDITHEAAP